MATKTYLAKKDHTHTAADVGAAAASHKHAASDINSGTLSSDRLPTVPVAKGGTGATTAAAALTNLGITATAAELNKMDGVTATTAELNYVDGVTSNIQTQLNGKAASGHKHAAGDITSGTLPVARGGTGATDAATALTNLGAVPLDGSKDMTGNLKINKSSYPSFVLYSGDSTRRAILQWNGGAAYLRNQYPSGFSALSIYNDDDVLANRIQLVIDDTAWYRIFGEHNTELLKNYVLPLDGSVSMQGWLNLNGNSIAGGYDASNLTLFSSGSGEAIARRLTIYSVGNQSLKNAIYLWNGEGSDAKYYPVFGEHNKPSGTYSGNGGSQTIDTGGLGDVILVQLTGSGGGMALVSKSGAILKLNSNNTVSAVADTEAKFINGVLTLNSSNYALNRSGYGYNYQVL